MTSPPHPFTKSPEEQKPEASQGTVPVPTAPPAPAAAGLQRGQGLNAVFTVLVLALAFLSASFLARNSDLWFHLATGRLLTRGEFSFGSDPFAYTTQQVYWACHSWLFDWVLYRSRGLIGDAGLIVVKALLVTALAALLLRIRRRAGAVWLSVLSTTLAILAISPRLLLQPACVSYFFLGLTFWLLWRLQQQAEASRPIAFASGSLLLVFILWVNVDEWFLLGPLLVALFWLGERLAGQRRIPGWLAPAGLVVCLLNPYTYHAFTLPAELSIVPWTSGLGQDARFHNVFASPWEPAFLRAAWHLNAAFLGYYVLTVAGLLSFLLYRSAFRDWRILVWLPFALLAAWQARLIPFFAVVAAPVTALNWQDFLAARTTTRSTGNRFVLGTLCLALVLALLSLNALTWMGWLAGYDREERHVAWGVQEDSSLRHAAETLHSWRSQGMLPDSERILALAPEVAHYAAYFCPEEKQFFDHRYPLFPQAAREYETVCAALLQSAKDKQDHRTEDWQQVLRDHKIGIVVFYEHDTQRLLPILNRLLSDTKNWTLLHVAGQGLIAGWNPARRAHGFDSLAFDADRMAFGSQEGNTRLQAPSAPGQGPPQLPERREFWDRLAHPPTVPSWESTAASVYLYDFQSSEVAHQEQQKLVFLRAYAGSLAGLLAQPPGITQAAAQLVSSRKFLFADETGIQFREDLGPFFAPLLNRSPALPLLAIRAARRAIAVDPRDANAWHCLGQAYLFLRNLTCERSAEGLLPPLAQLRNVQIVTALEQALRLDPNLETVHHDLAFLYGASNFLDQSLEHRREELRLSRQAGPKPGETAKDFAYRLELLDKDTAKLVALVEENRKKFAAGSRTLQGDRLALARRALEMGLARQAVDEILLHTPADVLGPGGIRLELELMLALGRAQEVRTLLSDRGLRASKHRIGYFDLLSYHVPAYEWLHVLGAASVGDYTQCRDDLRAIQAAQQAGQDQIRQQVRDIQRAAQALAPSLFSGAQAFLPAFMALNLARAVENEKRIEANLQILRAQQADMSVIEGLIALEQGEVDAARSVFAEAQKMGAASSFAGRPIATDYLGRMRR